MKSFVVKYQTGGSSVIKHKAKMVDLLMDGCIMEKAVSFPDDKERIVKGMVTSDNTRRPFIFADIQTTGADYTPFPTISPYSAYTRHSRVIQMKTQCPAAHA